MAYQIDFTERWWVLRNRRKKILLLLALAFIGGVAYTAYDCYVTYQQPTLNQRLAEYELAAHPIENINKAWDEALTDYNAIVRYYRLLWAANPTNFLNRMSAADAPRLGRRLKPAYWTLKTGGACELGYNYAFGAGDENRKSELVKNLEADIARAVTGVVTVANGKVDVTGVPHQNFLDVNGFSVTVRFALPDIEPTKAKVAALGALVKEIADQRKKVQEAKIVKDDGAAAGPRTAQAIMMAYLPKQYEKGKADFPAFANVLNVKEWFSRADKFIAQHRIPGDDRERKALKETWNKVGEARLPWERYRALDNETIVARTKVLSAAASGVRPLKAALEQLRGDCRRKLEPFIDAYDADDVFNKHILREDLVDRAARSAKVRQANSARPERVADAPPATLVKDGKKYAFSWVRWKLSLGGGERAREEGPGEAKAGEPLPLGKVADCLVRVENLGPGYALDAMKITFNSDGDVANAEMEGLLPVQKAETMTEAK